MENNRYLLDTHIISDLIKNPQGVAARHLEKVEQRSIFTTIVVACELRFGAKKKGSTILTSRIEALLDSIEVVPLGDNVDRNYALVRSHLEIQGTPIGPNDLLIASHALSLGAIMVTANIKEYSRVPGLRVENWLTS